MNDFWRSFLQGMNTYRYGPRWLFGLHCLATGFVIGMAVAAW